MASGNGLASLGVEGATAAAQALSLPAEAYGNDLISSVNPINLKLTTVDDRIYTSFKASFSDLNIKNLDPDMLKTAEAKEKWRPFCNQFDGVVEDFNYGTLLRLDCVKDYTEENTIFATRIQFFAIEIARNREGFNTPVFQAKKQPS
ncbi:protein PBDC1-like isoform X2 [Oncorhynchus masou masou]|uniref:protein PBDC1-like isoform X2 n=1 Tax=Oncorhynchus masou masou TaxID=90313 RepID=UPI003183CF9D